MQPSAPVTRKRSDSHPFTPHFALRAAVAGRHSLTSKSASSRSDIRRPRRIPDIASNWLSLCRRTAKISHQHRLPNLFATFATFAKFGDSLNRCDTATSIAGDALFAGMQTNTCHCRCSQAEEMRCR